MDALRRRTNPNLLGLIAAAFDQRAGFALAHISGAQDARDAHAMFWYQDARRYWAWAPTTGRVEDDADFIDIRGIPIDVDDPRHPGAAMDEANTDKNKSTSHNGD